MSGVEVGLKDRIKGLAGWVSWDGLAKCIYWERNFNG